MKKILPPLPKGFEYRLDLRDYVTPKALKQQPVHRWFWFPHSFSPNLIDEILRYFPVPSKGRILDPFVGAGTTVLRALQLGYAATGSDLFPLSLFVSRVKTQALEQEVLERYLGFILEYRPIEAWHSLSERLRKAFLPQEAAHLEGIRQKINEAPPAVADFFHLALLQVVRKVSRAVADGGWFRWVQKEDQSAQIKAWFAQQARMQIQEIKEIPKKGFRSLVREDARTLSSLQGKYDLVVTSPPYPNRHDYSRVFHIEMLWLWRNEEKVKLFRKNSLRSHVEAVAPNTICSGYTMPESLARVLSAFPPNADPRVLRMLQGYFEDMYLVLRALWHLLQPGAIAAFVVGNVRHAGVMVPVDLILIEIAEQIGYTLQTAWVARLRGNSAQQMGRFGREPARETVVILRK